MKRKQFLSLLLITFLNGVSSAQNLGLEDAASDFWDEVRSAAPFIFVAIFLVGTLFNISKVMGQERDYKGFLSGVGLFALSMILIGSIVTYLLSLSF